jgi:cytochrome c peroxidase
VPHAHAIAERGRCLRVLAPAWCLLFGVTASPDTPQAASGREPLVATATFAAALVDLETGAIAARRARIEAAVRGAAVSKSAYLVLPELAWGDGGQGDPAGFLAELARTSGVRIAAAVPHARGSGEYSVEATLWDTDGRVLVRRSKGMPGADEGPGFVRGDPWDALESWDDGKGFRIGVIAGGDLLGTVPRLSERGASVVLVSAGWPTRDASRWRAVCEDLSRRHRLTLVVAAPEEAGGGVYGASSRDTIRTKDGAVRGVVLPPESSPFPAALGLPSIPAPRTYSATAELVELGRDLFFDASLSADHHVSCASCHRPERSFSNGQATGSDVSGRPSARNVISLLNVAHRATLHWDGVATSLESQAKLPMSHRAEMNLHYLDGVARVRAQARYVHRFREIVGHDPEFEDVARALASYQRTLVSADSPFDRYHHRGDQQALTQAARRGLRLFTGKAGCAGCHAVGESYSLLTDNSFHNTGVGYRDGSFSDVGLGRHTDARRNGFFATPSLRNVALTAPYMHDGSLPTLEDVIAHYDRGGNANPGLDPAIRPLGLSVQDRGDLVAFLRALTGSQAFTADGRPKPPPGAPPAPVFAAIDHRAGTGDVTGDRAAVERSVRAAVAAGAHVLVLPEHVLGGEVQTLTQEAEQAVIRGAQTAGQSFASLARELGAWLAVPLPVPGARPGAFFIALTLFDATGGVAGQHLKTAARPEWGDGSAQRGRGDTLQVIPSPFGRLGLLFGDEIDSSLARLAERGAETVLVAASWPGDESGRWARRVQEAALRSRVSVVVANLGKSTTARSFVVDRHGTLAPRVGSDRPFVLLSVGSERLRAGREAPLGLPPLPFPAHRRFEPARVALGGALFFDGRLSRDGEVSCGSCHDPEQAFSDRRPVARGVFGRLGTLNTPTLLNAAYRSLFGWEGTAASLEEQIARALVSWHEMDFDAERALATLAADPDVSRRFRDVTGRDEIRENDVTGALAEYVRTLVAGESPFDRFYYRDDGRALDATARAGLNLFQGKAGCAGCHRVRSDHALFTDHRFHNTGVGYHPRFEYLGYGGDGLEASRARPNEFKGEYLTPSLRNVALTAPYMHDGRLKTLADVVAFYDRGGIPNPFLDRRMKPLGLTAGEQAALVAFLESLTSARRPQPPPRRPIVETAVAAIP